MPGVLVAAGRSLRRNLSYVVLLGVGLALAPFEPGYNHVFGAYLVATLAVFNLKLWLGEASAFDLISVATFLAVSLAMAVRGDADVVPYLGFILFGLMLASAAVRLARRRPLVFRDEARVAENYLDTAARGLLALGCVAMTLAWMPQPRYISGPFTALLAFRLAAPLRRWLYPRLLSLGGVSPTDGSVREVVRRRGFTPARAGILAASLVVVGVVSPSVVLTPERIDVSVPAPYTIPSDLLHERREELARYVATPEGSLDPGALTELGLVLHNLGLFHEPDLVEALSVLDRAVFLAPQSAQARAWRGSTVVASALYETRTLPRMRLISDGMRELDRAVAMAPDDPIVRLARLDVCLGVPRFLRTLRVAREDAEALLRLARTHPEAVDPILPWVHQRAGDTFSLAGETERARREWEAALALLPEDSEDHRIVAAQLRGEASPAARLWARRAEGPGGPS